MKKEMTCAEVVKAAKKPPLEKQVENRLYKKVKELGGLCWKFVSPNNRGVSDRVVLIDGRTVYVEVKRDGGKMTLLQERFKQKVIDNGGEFTCVTGYEGVDNFIWQINEEREQTKKNTERNYADIKRFVE